jgi:hypothetical protein
VIQCFMVQEVDHEHPTHHWRRLDSDQVFGNAPVGGMWWSYMTERFRPMHADDRPPDVDLQWLRETFASSAKTLWRGPSPTDPTLPAAHPSYSFIDGPALWVMTPGGSWCVDSRASNCTQPYDYAHRCWIRHGEPPSITVDKNGLTCQAGAGSIAVGSYHGFLRNGQLT